MTYSKSSKREISSRGETKEENGNGVERRRSGPAGAKSRKNGTTWRTL